MKLWLSLGATLFLLAGCATTASSPEIASVERNQPEPKMYIEEKPAKEFFLKKEKETFSLRPVPQLSARESIVENAMMYLNKRDGGDCSGFVTLVNVKSGHPFFRDQELSGSYDNARKSRAMFNLMSKKGNAFEAKLPHIGDLVFFENTETRTAKMKAKEPVKVASKPNPKDKTKTPPKPQPQPQKQTVINVSENITHVGIVTKVEADGTVEFIHHSNGKNILDYMNFNFPMLTHKDGKKINTYMKRCPSKNGAAQPQCMNIAFFVAYGTF